MNPQFKKGVLQLCVLCSLLDGDKYGFELVDHVSRGINMSEGTIYPLLKRLRDEELVSTYLVESSEGPTRKYYKLTVKGERHTLELRAQWQGFVEGVQSVIYAGGKTS